MQYMQRTNEKNICLGKSFVKEELLYVGNSSFLAPYMWGV
jgi:hypothetical protein